MVSWPGLRELRVAGLSFTANALGSSLDGLITAMDCMLVESEPIYLDHHATTPCDPRVVEAMLPTFDRQFGNAASRQHYYGWQAEALVEAAREQVAALLHCGPSEVIFTSGATESDNLAIKGVAQNYAAKGRHIVTNTIEHPAVLDTCKYLEAHGFTVTYLRATREGRIEPEAVAEAIGPETILVSIMLANNEIGTINPIAEIGRICKERGVIFHTDAVQALAYLPCDVEALGVDLLSVSAHKMYGPKGVGALYVRRRNPRVALAPLIHGGGHERGMRSGTLNVSGIVGLGKACELAAAEGPADAKRIAELRNRLWRKLDQAIPGLQQNGSVKHRLPNNLNVSFPGIDADALMTGMKGVAVSSGSACTSAKQEPSHVLRGIGLADDQVQSSIRFGLGRFTTAEEIDRAAAAVLRAHESVRAGIG